MKNTTTFSRVSALDARSLSDTVASLSAMGNGVAGVAAQSQISAMISVQGSQIESLMKTAAVLEEKLSPVLFPVNPTEGCGHIGETDEAPLARCIREHNDLLEHLRNRLGNMIERLAI